MPGIGYSEGFKPFYLVEQVDQGIRKTLLGDIAAQLPQEAADDELDLGGNWLPRLQVVNRRAAFEHGIPEVVTCRFDWTADGRHIQLPWFYQEHVLTVSQLGKLRREIHAAERHREA
jgi:hypothetical protein